MGFEPGGGTWAEPIHEPRSHGGLLMAVMLMVSLVYRACARRNVLQFPIFVRGDSWFTCNMSGAL